MANQKSASRKKCVKSANYFRERQEFSSLYTISSHSASSVQSAEMTSQISKHSNYQNRSFQKGNRGDSRAKSDENQPASYAQQFNKLPKLPADISEELHQRVYSQGYKKYYNDRTQYMKNKFDNLSLQNKHYNKPFCPVHVANAKCMPNSQPDNAPVNPFVINKIEECYWAQWKPGRQDPFAQCRNYGDYDYNTQNQYRPKQPVYCMPEKKTPKCPNIVRKSVDKEDANEKNVEVIQEPADIDDSSSTEICVPKKYPCPCAKKRQQRAKNLCPSCLSCGHIIRKEFEEMMDESESTPDQDDTGDVGDIGEDNGGIGGDNDGIGATSYDGINATNGDSIGDDNGVMGGDDDGSKRNGSNSSNGGTGGNGSNGNRSNGSNGNRSNGSNGNTGGNGGNGGNGSNGGNGGNGSNGGNGGNGSNGGNGGNGGNRGNSGNSINSGNNGNGGDGNSHENIENERISGGWDNMVRFGEDNHQTYEQYENNMNEDAQLQEHEDIVEENYKKVNQDMYQEHAVEPEVVPETPKENLPLQNQTLTTSSEPRVFSQGQILQLEDTQAEDMTPHVAISNEYSESAIPYLKHTDSFIINSRKQSQPKPHVSQPKFLKLRKNLLAVGSGNLKGHTYPLKSALKRQQPEKQTAKGMPGYNRPASPVKKPWY